jgi:hypothetical protein
MGIGGFLECDDCGCLGPPINYSVAHGSARELRRCKRCGGLTDVLTAELDEETGEWVKASGRGRCRTIVDGVTCGSQTLERLTDEEMVEPSAPCPQCDGRLTLGPNMFID